MLGVDQSLPRALRRVSGVQVPGLDTPRSARGQEGGAAVPPGTPNMPVTCITPVIPADERVLYLTVLSIQMAPMLDPPPVQALTQITAGLGWQADQRDPSGFPGRSGSGQRGRLPGVPTG